MSNGEPGDGHAPVPTRERCPVTAPGLTWPFVRPPRLPVVLPPQPGESLSGWLRAMTEMYRVGWRDFLHALGLKAPARPRSLDINPPWPWLLALEEQTGVSAVFIRDCMTFEKLSAQMCWLVHRGAPCPICVASKGADGSRPVEWLADLAPWTLICDRHPCSVLASEVGDRHLWNVINHDVKALAFRLRSTASSDVFRAFPSVPLSAAACIVMVDAINTRLKLRVGARPHGGAVFTVEDILMDREAFRTSRSRPRNSRALSAWYAWHVLAFPEIVLHRHTRCRDHDQLYDLLTVLFDFRHTWVISMRWEYALGLCAKADAGPDGTEEERCQVRMLHDRRFRSLVAGTGREASAMGTSAARPMHH